MKSGSVTNLVEHHGSGMQPSYRLKEMVEDGQHFLIIVVSMSGGVPDRWYKIPEMGALLAAGRSADEGTSDEHVH